jgi:hypothetical protein
MDIYVRHSIQFFSCRKRSETVRTGFGSSVSKEAFNDAAGGAQKTANKQGTANKNEVLKDPLAAWKFEDIAKAAFDRFKEPVLGLTRVDSTTVAAVEQSNIDCDHAIANGGKVEDWGHADPVFERRYCQGRLAKHETSSHRHVRLLRSRSQEVGASTGLGLPGQEGYSSRCTFCSGLPAFEP